MKRSGFIVWVFVIAFLLIGLACAVGAYAWYTFNSGPVIDANVLYATASKGYFLHEVTERGSIDSASNVEVRCRVESPNGTMIIWVIPEGTHVKKGDLLCELDSSSLQEKRTQQEITVATSRAKMTQSKANLEVARLTYDEYTEGLYIQERDTINNKIAKAEEDWNRAINDLHYTQTLLNYEYVTDMQLRADEENAKQKLNDKKIASLELDVLQKYTKKKKDIELKASIETAAIQYESDQTSHELDKDRLKYYQDQLDACKVTAPEDGQVVYATHPWRRDEVIKEGTFVRDRQTIIKLPDPNQMQVKGYVNEASVSQVKVKQPAKIELEAVSGRTFRGKVKQVNDYPEPDNFFGSAVKEYQTLVSLDDIAENEKSLIRSGLTAKVKITVDERNDVLMVPVQCLFEHARVIYCLTYVNGVWDKKEIKINATNNEMAVIESGLEEGERVVMGAWKYRDKVELPPLAEGQQTRQFGASSVGRGEDENGESTSEEQPSVDLLLPDEASAETSPAEEPQGVVNAEGAAQGGERRREGGPPPGGGGSPPGGGGARPAGGGGPPPGGGGGGRR